MATCSTCSHSLPVDAFVCPSCGTPLSDASVPTRISPETSPPPTAKGTSPSFEPAPSPPRFLSSGSRQAARFVPGTILAGRYRIIGLLGRGGMGEVYQAEDLKLEHSVALKFLPDRLATNAAMLARFHREVRIARQITHPSVCRVHDIGEVEGQHFISMEFIDGEDLSSLLRRIGRLPADKAVEIARQLCAGLQAAHDNGVLHRDLKPANVMIDGRGKVRITDFGLAGLAEEVYGDETFAGTPAYMAPEQLTGKGVTIQSDLYALGLMLYEVFTGRRAFEANTMAELVRLQERSTPTNPSNLVKEIDPLAERAILHCLHKDPQKRPSSAIQVAAALPGGDPLAAALAAGETPSPEMVAAAPQEGTLRPAVAVVCLAAVLIGLVLVVLSAGKEQMSIYGLEKPPDALTDRAKTVARKLGYTDPPTGSEYGFGSDEDLVQYVRDHDASPDRWRKLAVGQPTVVYFWYRQSPRHLVPYNGKFLSPEDPPLTISGMANMTFDPQGRLRSLEAVPPQFDEQSGLSPVPDWSLLFTEAGLDLANFKPTEPKWLPQVSSDSRAAWEGVFPNQPQIPLRIEAAAYRGRPVYFELLGPWAKPWRLGPERQNNRLLPYSILLLVVILVGVMLAWRNLHLGRGDRKGAFRLALCAFLVDLLYWALLANHVPLAAEFHNFFLAVAWALFRSGTIWLLYLALEPYVRRRWPHRIIAWSRLLAGQVRDPLVGRDLLIGGLAAVGLSLLYIPVYITLGLFSSWIGKPVLAPSPGLLHLNTLHGLSGLASEFLEQLPSSMTTTLCFLFALLLLTIISRREWLALGLAWCLFTFILIALVLGSQAVSSIVYWYIVGLWVATMIVLLTRYGLLVAIVFLVCGNLLFYSPITSDLSAWYANGTIFVVSIIAAICGYGFYRSLGGQRVFHEKLLED